MSLLSPRLLQAVDLILSTTLESRGRSLMIEPSLTGHRIAFENGAEVENDSEVFRRLGEAVVARLLLLAELDPTAEVEQVGRLRVAHWGGLRELLVVTRPTPRGLALELRQLPAAARQAAPAGEAEVPRMGGYRLGEVLGKGGMGVVYRAQHEVLDREVAIKVVHEEWAANASIAAMFLCEARAASRTRHPGVVEVIDFGRLDDGRTFLVMELVKAPTLAESLDLGPLYPRLAIELTARIAEALACVHAAGVVHRDLKPANVFVLPDHQIKIADFGAAKLVREPDGPSLTRLGMILGTPEYMSPEHCQGKSVDHRTDIYALGCMLYEMLSGEMPFTGANAMDVQMQQIQSPRPAPSSIYAGLNRSLIQLVQKAMAKEPAARHQSAEELLADLRRLEGSVRL